MRVLLLTQHFPPESGPHAYRWGWLSSRFAELGHDVDVIVPTWRPDDHAELDRSSERVHVHEVAAQVPGAQLRKRLTNELLTALAAFRLGTTTPRPDVIIGTVPSLPTLPVALALGFRRRVPVVAEIRDAWPDLVKDWQTWGDTGTATQPRRVSGRIVDLINRLVPLLTRAYTAMQRRSALMITTTESWASILRQRRMPRTVVIRNTSMAVHEQLPPPPERPGNALHVLYVGNIGRAQHLATAIRAANLCHQQGVPVRLRIIGAGAESDAMHQFNERLGYPAEIFDRVDVEDVPAQYAWADSILIILRSWRAMEWSVPSKLYEALSSGRHLSVSAPGESAQIVEATGAGDAVPPENPEALAALWTELADHRERLVRSDVGAQWARDNVDPKILADRYLLELRDVVGR